MTPTEAARMDLTQADVVLDVAARALKGQTITDPIMVRVIRNLHATATGLLQQIPAEAPTPTEPA